MDVLWWLGRYCGACFGVVVSVSVTCRAGHDRINHKTKIDVKTHTMELISVNADVQWRPSRKRWPTCHYKVMWHGLIDGNFMNICWQMRLGDFLASKDLQELNYVDSVERKSLKNLAVIIWLVFLHELQLGIFMDISSGFNGGLCQYTNSWRFNKHHDVCTVAPRAMRVCAIPPLASWGACNFHVIHVITCYYMLM